MSVIQLNFTKTNLSNFFQKGGGGARRAGPGSAFEDEQARARNFIVIVKAKIWVFCASLCFQLFVGLFRYCMPHVLMSPSCLNVFEVFEKWNLMRRESSSYDLILLVHVTLNLIGWDRWRNIQYFGCYNLISQDYFLNDIYNIHTWYIQGMFIFKYQNLQFCNDFKTVKS